MTQWLMQIILPISLAFMMLGIGLSVKKQNFIDLKNNKKAILGGFLLQVVLMPLLVLLLILLFNIRAEYAVALMLLACCPGGVTSNAITFAFSGIVALSVVLTLLSSLISPFIIPTVTAWSLEHFMGEHVRQNFSLTTTIGKLFILSIVPILLGLLIQRFALLWCERHSQLFRKLSGWWFFVLIILMVIGHYQLLQNVIVQLGWFILLLAIATIVLGYSGAKILALSSAYRLTLAIEVGIQNAGVGLIITGTVLNNPTMTMILIAYGVLMQIPVFIFAFFYQRHMLNDHTRTQIS